MSTIAFWKMQGTGNDFVVFDGTELPDGVDLAALGQRWCDRHFGIGADGLLIRWPSEKAHARMQIINADGSEANMCGNGIRCLAVYLAGQGAPSGELTIETLGGLIRPTLLPDGQVRVAMGRPRLRAAEVPVHGYGEGRVIEQPIHANGRTWSFTAVSMGNPHAVIFVDDVEACDVAALGQVLERHPAFPNRANIEFVQVLNPEEVRMQVWERGAGITLACGTGACATLVAGVLTGRMARRAAVHVPGGTLQIEWPDDEAEVFMTGPAGVVFQGQGVLPG